MIILTLPTGRYILGAATRRRPDRAPRRPRPAPAAPSPARRLAAFPTPPATSAAGSASLALAALVAIGFLGPRDPLGNLLTLTVWTLRLGRPRPRLACSSATSGAPIDPWTGPVTAARRLLGRTGAIGLARLGHWPAVAGLLAFAWFEIVSLAPDDPAVLARAVARLLARRSSPSPSSKARPGSRQGEALTVFFGFIAPHRPALVRARRPPRSRSSPARPAPRSSPCPPLAPERRRLRRAGARHRQLRRPAPTPSGGSPASASTRSSSPAARPSPAPTPSASSPPGR